jgi:flagellar motor protein MotB
VDRNVRPAARLPRVGELMSALQPGVEFSLDGVTAAMLSATGYGDSQPRGSNHSEQGRFQNRRIEYTLVR